MKLHSLVFALLALTAVSIPAQAGVGLLGGLSFHSVSTDDDVGSGQDYSPDSKLGFVGGLAFNTDLTVLNLEVDVLYNHRTLNIASEGVSSPAIEVPVLARFSLIPEVLDIGVGPYGAFNVGANDLGYNSPDIGAVGSVRVTIPIPGFHLVIDGRYNHGFTDLSDLPLVDVSTREFKVLAGFDIPFVSND